MMVQMLATTAFAFVLSAEGVMAPGAQAPSIPLTISISVSPGEVAVGSLVHADVRLKNYLGNLVAAPEDIAVTLHSALGADGTVVVRRGRSVAETDVRMTRPGVTH